ncbi:hypothetical protein IDJ77_10800 [Mucilaginibacter sp. ZT4R22]|uniref:DUF7674 domain-containing protein n=1 Tax=Mucilaginibacter pankratovii TaxID=2772110 RepID=A0ABR7WS04_9SPHI|nr:hypothetical protein [Mucilaginibacter pankratovii]MBD1364297.1 hypothetical protein [Mucilaginibacter pankratovii]
MKFDSLVALIYQEVPEFKVSYEGEPDENYSNSFLGDLGLFTRNAIVDKAPYAIKCLKFIDDTVNKNKGDEDLVNMFVINVLEVLTDYASTQKAAITHFTGNCLKLFKELFSGGYFMDLAQT